MKQKLLWLSVVCLAILLVGCGKASDKATPKKETMVEENTVTYTTITGSKVDIPKDPKRVIYIGDTLGDFIVLNLPVVGSNLVNADSIHEEGKLGDIVDVGNPGDLERIMELQPDLIINTYSQDEKQHQALAKIAPTIPFNSSLPYQERVTEIGNIFDITEQTDAIIAKFETQADEMWDKLQLKEDESATIFLQLGSRLFVMGNRALGAIFYDDKGFAIPEAVQKDIIDKKLTFVEVSEELLPNYAGDNLFVLAASNEESEKEVESTLNSAVWSTLPAVKEGNVFVAAADWNTDSLLALENLFQKVPEWMHK